MKIESLTPIVTTPRLADVRAFYVAHFGFEVTWDDPQYLGLRAGPDGAPELGFMAPDALARDVFDGRGTSFAFRVADVDAAHESLRSTGAPIVEPPADRPWGARTMIVRDPLGVLLFVTQPIECTASVS